MGSLVSFNASLLGIFNSLFTSSIGLPFVFFVDAEAGGFLYAVLETGFESFRLVSGCGGVMSLLTICEPCTDPTRSCGVFAFEDLRA